MIPAVSWFSNHLIVVYVDPVAGIAIVTLLFMMLQSEHERCDRVRAGWREVRRANFAATSAIQFAQKMHGTPVAGEYFEEAQSSL